jgi:hypothetical protein
MFVTLGFQSYILTLIIVDNLVLISDIFPSFFYCTKTNCELCKNTEYSSEVSFGNNFNIAVK